jgi:hypothetical protein
MSNTSRSPGYKNKVAQTVTQSVSSRQHQERQPTQEEIERYQSEEAAMRQHLVEEQELARQRREEEQRRQEEEQFQLRLNEIDKEREKQKKEIFRPFKTDGGRKKKKTKRRRTKQSKRR